MARAGENPARCDPCFGDGPTREEKIWLDAQRGRSHAGIMHELEIAVLCDCAEPNPRTGELRIRR